jgi:hypothetical protein
MFITLPFLFTIGYCRASPRLSRKSPQGSLISFPVIASMLAHLVSTTIVQILSVYYMSRCEDFVWLDPEEEDEDLRLQSFETTCVFLSSTFHYLMSGVILSYYDPFLKPFFSYQFAYFLSNLFSFYIFFVSQHFTIAWNALGYICSNFYFICANRMV